MWFTLGVYSWLYFLTMHPFYVLLSSWFIVMGNPFVYFTNLVTHAHAHTQHTCTNTQIMVHLFVIYYQFATKEGYITVILLPHCGSHIRCYLKYMMPQMAMFWLYQVFSHQLNGTADCLGGTIYGIIALTWLARFSFEYKMVWQPYIA